MKHQPGCSYGKTEPVNCCRSIAAALRYFGAPVAPVVRYCPSCDRICHGEVTAEVGDSNRVLLELQDQTGISQGSIDLMIKRIRERAR